MSDVWELARYQLIEDIDMVDGLGRICIFSGECNWRVYNDRDVAESLQRARRKGARIDMVIGPILSVPETDGEVYLSELAREGIINVFPKPYRHSLPHYRVMEGSDKKAVSLESFHEPLNPAPKIELLKNFWVTLSMGNFKDFIESYDLSAGKDLAQSLVFLNDSQIRKLLSECNGRGKPYFSYLEKNNIVDMLER